HLQCAVLKEQVPFGPSDAAGEQLGTFVSRLAAGERFAQVDEAVGIPGGLLEKVRHALRKLVLRSFRKLASGNCQRLKDGMLADTAEPVLRVSEVGLATVQNAVPVAAVRGFNLLADGVGLVQKIVEQPECGETAAGG